MSDRNQPHPEPERRRSREEIAAEIHNVAQRVQALVQANPCLQTLPAESFREVDEANEIAGRYIEWREIGEEPMMELNSHLLTISIHHRTVETCLRALRA